MPGRWNSRLASLAFTGCVSGHMSGLTGATHVLRAVSTSFAAFLAAFSAGVALLGAGALAGRGVLGASAGRVAGGVAVTSGVPARGAEAICGSGAVGAGSGSRSDAT